jgi:hypothetical protein
MFNLHVSLRSENPALQGGPLRFRSGFSALPCKLNLFARAGLDTDYALSRSLKYAKVPFNTALDSPSHQAFRLLSIKKAGTC